MSAIDSSHKRLLGVAWLAFALVNLVLTFVLVGEETIPYHLIWASYAFLYGLLLWSRRTAMITFWAITITTAVPLVLHARAGIIGISECSEIVLMGVIIWLLVWHVDRHRATQQRLTEVHEHERVRAANRELAARFGSHEVRTRLTVARGFVELIRDAADDATIRSDAELVLGELDRASALATQVLTLVQVETASPRVPVHLGDLFDGIVRRWATTCDRHWMSDSSVGIILADPERTQAALDCLIENAVKFTTPADSIAVEGHIDGGDVVVSVTDTGAGIPADDLTEIFEVFRTGSTAGTRAGSGLGLAIVTAIAEARNGRVEVTSTPGSGSRFSMRVPLAGARVPQITDVAPIAGKVDHRSAGRENVVLEEHGDAAAMDSVR
jgi:two-component system OmpR family sensor kinase